MISIERGRASSGIAIAAFIWIRASSSSSSSSSSATVSVAVVVAVVVVVDDFGVGAVDIERLRNRRPGVIFSLGHGRRNR